MKNLAAFLFVLIFSCFCSAQNLSGKSTEEVSILFTGFETDVSRSQRTTYSGAPYVQNTDNTYGAGAPRDTIQYRRQIETVNVGNSEIVLRTVTGLRNNTQKEIASIEYNFTVIRKKDGKEKELHKYRLANKTTIKAGESKKLYGSTNTIKASRNVYCKAEITRVIYRDGSVWIP
ncbi:MAG: hypothetical protein H0U87_02525 [Acidobacteria bacterium]|jgi:hypothetical protein|nr:hypothetical protein [Acidobacteriota bacterium]